MSAFKKRVTTSRSKTGVKSLCTESLQSFEIAGAASLFQRCLLKTYSQ